MKLNLRSISFIWHHRHRLFRAHLVSTNVLTSSLSSFSSSSVQIHSLHQRILRVKDPSLSILPILDQWLEIRKRFDLRELRKCIKKLREDCRYIHALQVSEWMTDKSGNKLASPDVAVQLHLISKIHGLEKAEEYFLSIPLCLQNYQVYGAFIHCYPRAKQLEKTEAMMQNMKDMGFVKTADCYHTLLNLYSRTGTNEEKLYLLMQEMEERGIIHNRLTYNVWLRAYVACSDISGMEKLLMKMEANPRIKMNFNSCIIAANGYLKAGNSDKTLMMLKRSEELISEGNRQTYETLFSLYAAIGNKTDVYRLWNLHKQVGRVLNTGYVCMISALLKLDDLDGAEQIWEEWDSGTNSFDICIPNLMINAYSKKGSMEKAEGCINKIGEKGEEPNASSWDYLAGGYVLDGQMMRAVETIKKAILRSKIKRSPRITTLTRCLQYLNGQGDKEAAEELFSMIKEQCHLSTGAYNRLSSCISHENLASSASDQIEDDDQTFDELPAETALPEMRTI